MVGFIKLLCVGYWRLAHCGLDIRLSGLHLKTACVNYVVIFCSFSPSSLLLFLFPHSPISPKDEACETVVIWSKFSNGFFKVNHFALYFESDVSFYIRQWPSGHDSIIACILWNRKPSSKVDAIALSSSLHAEFSEVASMSHYWHNLSHNVYVNGIQRDAYISGARILFGGTRYLWILSMEPASFNFSGAWKFFGPLVYRIGFEVLTLVTMKNCVCVVGWVRTEVRWISILTIHWHLTWWFLWQATMKFPYVSQGLNCNWLAYTDTCFVLVREKIMRPADNPE